MTQLLAENEVKLVPIHCNTCPLHADKCGINSPNLERLICLTLAALTKRPQTLVEVVSKILNRSKSKNLLTVAALESGTSINRTIYCLLNQLPMVKVNKADKRKRLYSKW